MVDRADRYRPKASRERWSFALALTILVGVATFAYLSVDTALVTLGWVEHTGKALQQMDEVTAAYARASAARRAYVVAGDASQLADIPGLDARVLRALDDERALLWDNPEQMHRLQAFSALIATRLENLDLAVLARRRAGAAAETPDGLALTAEIRAQREAIEAEEERLLAQRDALTRRDMGRTKGLLVAGTLGSMLILVIAFRRLSHEIERRQRSEEALRASETFLGSIVENIPDMIFVKEAGELRFERINRAGEDLLGVSRVELLRKNDYDFFPREQAEAFQAKDREALAAGAIVIDEEPIQTKRGERWLHTKKVPVLDDLGEPRYLLGISEDITDKRLAAAALTAAKEAAEAANKELEAFSYSVAHDLRAPLRAMNGFSHVLQEGYADKVDAEGREHLQSIRDGARQMGELIDGLLALAKISRGELARARVDLTKLVEACGEGLRKANPGRDVTLSVQPGLEAEGDARLLGALVENLLANAWKFTSRSAQGRVEVGRAERDGEQAFFVRDDGAGFEQEYVEKLFKPFQRLHAASEFEGSGIGLATVQRIVQRHGGRIWAEGAVGRGATFYFTL